MKPPDTSDPKPNPSSTYVDPLELWDTPNSVVRRSKKRFKSGDEIAAHPPVSRDVTEVIGMAWSRPSVSTFRAILNDTNISLRRSSTWMGVTFGLQMAFLLLVYAISGPDENVERSLYSDSQTSGAGTFCGAIICLPFIVMITLFLYSIFIVGLPHMVAQLMGGEGSFEQTAFVYAALYAPVYLVGSVLSLMAENGGAWVSYIGGALGVYLVIMLTTAIRATHEISWLKSFVSAVSLPILVVGFAFCLTVQFG